MATPSNILGPYGEKLYPTPASNPTKYRRARPLARDMRRAITQQDHAQMVTECTQLACAIPVLGGALRQMSEWAFAGDSWQPIHYGEDEVWGDLATDYLVHQVFPNCVRRTPNKTLIKAMQVSAKSWLVQGDDLALFGLDENGNPRMTVIPATSIGNGDSKKGWWSATNVNGNGAVGESGFGICIGGKFDGYRIYNGIIFNDEDEPIAARVLGWARNAENQFEATYADFELGFQHGAHMAFPYEWHGMGRPMPRISSAAIAWRDFQERDDYFQKGIKLAATKTVIHQLAEGQDAVEARGDAAEQITTTDANGNEQVIYVETVSDGDVTYIGSGENLKGLEYANPHPDVEAFAIRKLRETVFDLGWLFELIDLSSTGRAPTRLGCELVNNSIWQLQTIGEERMFWFTKFAIIHGMAQGRIPKNTSPVLDDAYKWTFGYPKEMSVDAGNDVTASLNRLRFGLTSQRIESARWGHVQKRIDRDRDKEVARLFERTKKARETAKANGLEISDREIMQLFWMPSQSPAQIPNDNSGAATAGNDANNRPPQAASPTNPPAGK